VASRLEISCICNDRDAAMMSSGPDQQQPIGRDAIGMGAE
jgi:hypothetical protein